MNLIIIKDKNNKLPNKDFLNLCYSQYGSFISFAYNFKSNIHVNKNYSDFDYFCEDLYKEADENGSVIILFSNDSKNADKIDNCFPLTISEEQTQKCFFKTIQPIIFCEDNLKTNNSEVIKQFVGFDFIKYNSLFDMVSNHQSSVILNNDGSIITLGYWLENNNLKLSSIVKEKDENKDLKENIRSIMKQENQKQFDLTKSFISHLSLSGIKQEKCLYCDNNNNLDVVNNIITLCERCQQRLNTFKCTGCQRLFTGIFYHYPNICSECFYKQPIIKEVLYALHSIAFECSSINYKNLSIKEIKTLNYLELSNKIFKEDKMFNLFSYKEYQEGKIKILKKLEFPVDKT